MPAILAAGLLDPHVGLIFWIALTFLLLLLLLRRFAWGPITAALEQREHTISESLSRAEIALAEARQIAADNERARREAELDAQRILQEARASAEKLRNEDLARTQEKIRQMEEQARAQREQEIEIARRELRAEVADLVVRATEKILHENLDPTRQRRLVEDFIAGLPTRSQ